MKVIYQRQKKGCGFACVKMLASHYLKRNDIQSMPEPECSEMAPSLKELIQYGRSLGISLMGYRFASIRDCFDFRSSPFLAVLNVSGLSHMVLIQKRKGPLVFYLDPADGRRVLSCRQMENLFVGAALFVSGNGGSADKKSSDGFRNRPKRSCATLLPVIIAFFPCLFFALRILLEGTAPASVLALFTIFGLLLAGAEAIVLGSCLHAFDREYAKELMNIGSEKRKEAFEAYYGFREAQIAGRCRSVTMLLASLCFVCYYLKNVLNPTPVGWCILCLSLFVLIFSGALEKKIERKAVQSEAAFINEKDENKLFLRFDKIKKNGRSYSLFLGLFFLFCLLSSSLLAMFGHQGTRNFSVGLFSFFLLLQIRSAISSLRVFKIAKQKKAYFRFFFPRRSKRNIRKTKPKKGKISL